LQISVNVNDMFKPLLNLNSAMSIFKIERQLSIKTTNTVVPNCFDYNKACDCTRYASHLNITNSLGGRRLPKLSK